MVWAGPSPVPRFRPAGNSTDLNSVTKGRTSTGGSGAHRKLAGSGRSDMIRHCIQGSLQLRVILDVFGRTMPGGVVSEELERVDRPGSLESPILHPYRMSTWDLGC